MDVFKKIFWGLVLILIDFRVQTFDLLPDFVGYLLIMNSLGSLAPLHLYFNQAKSLATIMVPLALFDLVELEATVYQVGFLTITIDLFWPIGVFRGIIELVMIVQILTGITKLAETHGIPSLAKTADQRRYLYFTIMLIGFIITRLVYLFPDLLTNPSLTWAYFILLLTYVIARIIVDLLILGVILRTSQELSPKITFSINPIRNKKEMIAGDRSQSSN